MENQTTFFEPNDMHTVPTHISFDDVTNLGDHIWILDGALPESFCEEVISQFEKNKASQYEGVTGGGMNKEVKDSKDLQITHLQDEKSREIDMKLFEYIHHAVGKMIFKLTSYPCTVGWSPDEMFHHDKFQLQKTLPGGKYIWHIENGQTEGCYRSGAAARSLTFVLYLNDVAEEQGGATGFLYQKTKVQPKTGRIVIFPPYWTHVHAGHPLLSGVKYIATGWFFSEAHKI